MHIESCLSVAAAKPNRRGSSGGDSGQVSAVFANNRIKHKHEKNTGNVQPLNNAGGGNGNKQDYSEFEFVVGGFAGNLPESPRSRPRRPSRANQMLGAPPTNHRANTATTHHGRIVLF